MNYISIDASVNPYHNWWCQLRPMPQISFFFCFHLPSTWSWALLVACPEVNSTSPLMSGEVCLRVSLWTVPILSRCTWELVCKGCPFKLHTTDLTTGTDTSHSKQASSGALTSTSFSSLTINWAEAVDKTEVKLFAFLDTLYTFLELLLKTQTLAIKVTMQAVLEVV